MEPGPETQRAFRALDDLVIAKAPVWVPALIALLGALWLMRSLPWMVQAAVVLLLVWLFLDGDHRKRTFAVLVQAGRIVLNWLHEMRMRAAPERPRARRFAAAPVDRFGWLRNVPWIRVAAIGAVFVVLFFFLKPVVGFLTCPFGLCETKDELRAERDQLRGTIQTDEVLDAERRDVAQIGKTVAIERERVRVQSERGRDEIVAAAPEAEEPLDPELVRAWAIAIDRLCLYPTAAGALPAGC